MGVQGLKRDAVAFATVLLFSLILFNTVTWYDKYLYTIFEPGTYITWHLFLELVSIVMSSAIFFVTFYTSEKSHRTRSVIIACTFLAVALLDTFHTLSYNGMPVFLTESSTAKATSFWIQARLTGSIGLLYASLIPANRTIKRHRYLPLIGTVCCCAVLLYVTTYKLDIFPPLFIDGEGLTPLKIYLEYFIIMLQVVTIFIFIHIYLYEKDERGYIYLIIGLMVSVFSEMAFTLYTNVYDTYNLLGHIYKIVAYYLMFKALFVINVQKPYHSLHRAERKISIYANNLEKLVDKRTEEIAKANEKLIRDMDYAKNIQEALLPTNFPKNTKLEFSAKYLPCDIIGGDFYNVYRLDDDNVGILIGDVAGHGVSAAMVTVFINQNIYVRREHEDGRVKILTPKQVLTNLYYIYNRMSFPDEVYTVIFYGIYNLRTDILTYCSAGMNTAPLILDKSGHIKRIDAEGLPICKLGEHINPSYENRSIQIENGDAIIFYTDGLIEIDRKDPELFSEDNLIEYIKGMQDVSASEICETVVDAYHAIRGSREMIDDVTVLVVKINADAL